MREGKVISLGAIVYDRVLEVKELPPRPIKVRAQAWSERCGGPAATAAVAIAALGVNSSLWARVGVDPEGAAILAALREHGVDTSGMMQFEGASSGKSVILIDPAGERLIAGYQARGVAADPDRLALAEIASAGAVLADDSWREGAEALFNEARRQGVPSLLDGDIGTSDPIVLKHLSNLCDYAVYSDIGWKILTGLDTPDQGVIRDLAAEFGNVIGVTGGSEGSWWCIDGQLHHVPAIAVPVVDTTGAGDVFHGAFAAALAWRQPILQAAAYASAAAAEKIRRGNGWDGMPSHADIAALMRNPIPN